MDRSFTARGWRARSAAARGRAPPLRAGGRLSWQAPEGPEPPDGYRFDPADPLEDPHFAAGLGPHDQRKVEGRRDLLVYTTESLEEDLEVIGQIDCRIWLSSSALDTSGEP